MSLLQTSRPGLRVRVLPRFPAALIPGAGISFAIQNGKAAASLDYTTLAVQNSITDPSKFYTAVFDTVTGRYEQVRLDNLNLPTVTDVRTPVGDAAYAILNTDRNVGLTAALTASRTWTIPAASSVSPGRPLTIQDEAGGINGANILTLQPTGTDTLSGASSLTLRVPYAGIQLRSDGASKWSVVARSRSHESARGTAAFPAMSFAGDAGTGEWSPGPGILAISGSGVEVARFASGATTLTGTLAVSGAVSLTVGLTNANLAQMPPATLKGNAGAAAAAPSDIGLSASLAFAGATPVLDIAAGGVTNAKLANAPAATLKGNTGAAAGAPSDITVAQAKTMLGFASSGANSDITSLTGLTTALSVAQGGTGDTGSAWSAFTPTISATTGAFTTVSASMRYKTIGKTVIVQFTLATTTAGTAAGAAVLTLPFAAVANVVYMGIGRDNALTGKAVTALVSAGSLQIQFFDNTFPAASGSSISGTVVYEAA